MIISNTKFINNTYPNILPIEQFTWGVIGDTLSFFCDLELLTAAGAIDFYFNLIPNSKNPYNLSAPSNFAIANDVFKNLHSQTIQVFKGNLPTSNGQQLNLTPANPNNFFSGTFSILGVDITNKKYQIQGTFKILPLIREIDISGSDFVIPSYFSGGESLKAVFKINTKVSDLNATVIETTDSINISALFPNGNIGYLNERLNGGVADFSLQPSSTVWQNGLTNLDSSQVSKLQFQIKKASGNHLTSSVVNIRATTPTDTFGTALYLSTQNFDEVSLFANGTVANGINSKLITCKAKLNATDNTLLDVEVSFASGSYSSLALWVEVSENTTTTTFNNYNSNNVWVFFTEETPQIVDPVELQKLGTANSNLAFLYHYSDDANTQSFNHIKSFVGDWHQGLTKIVPKNGAVIEQIALQIKRTSGAILDDIITVNIDNLPVAQTRNFNLLNTTIGGGYRQQIDIQKVGNNIETKFAFKILPDWTAFADIVAAVIVRGTQRGLPFEIEFRSPNFVFQTYELTLNTNTEPNALGYFVPNNSRQLFINGSEVGKIINGEDNDLAYSFRDDVLNNLQADLTNLVGYFTVNFANEPETTQHSIHSEWDINPNSPFKEILGHTAGRAKINIISPPIPAKEAFIQSILDATKLVSIFGNQKQFSLTGRLDRKNPPQYVERYLLHLRGNNVSGDNFRPFISFVGGFTDFDCYETFTGSIVTGSLLFKYSEAVSPIWSAITAVSKEDVLQLIAVGSGTFKIMPFPIITSGLSECTLSFEIAKSGTAPANSWSYNFNNTYSIDTVIGFVNLVQFTSVAGAGANTFYNIRLSALTEWSQPVSFSLVNLNFDILALVSAGQPFELQIIDISNANLTLTYNYV